MVYFFRFKDLDLSEAAYLFRWLIDNTQEDDFEFWITEEPQTIEIRSINKIEYFPCDKPHRVYNIEFKKPSLALMFKLMWTRVEPEVIRIEHSRFK